jgi:hypothetical protein
MNEYTLKRKFGGRSKDGGELMFIVYNHTGLLDLIIGVNVRPTLNLNTITHSVACSRTLVRIFNRGDTRHGQESPLPSLSLVTHASISPLPACLLEIPEEKL